VVIALEFGSEAAAGGEQKKRKVSLMKK